MINRANKLFGVFECLFMAALGCFGAPSRAEDAPDVAPDKSKLSIERIFKGREFVPERFGPARWMKDGRSYSTLEPSKSLKDGDDIVLYEAGSGARRVLWSSSPSEEECRRGRAP